jgi:histidinol dehydrogenase
MKIIINPPQKDWKKILQRPVLDNKSLEEKVAAILSDIKSGGDEAIKKYTKQFDGVEIGETEVTAAEISEAIAQISPELKLAIQTAADNIRIFHLPQLQLPEIIETMPGIQCWRKNVAIEKVGLYIPGGTAPLFSTILMLGIPAAIAGCKEVILCSPPDKNGKLYPAILYAAQLAGITKIFKVGGVQAIAAMAYGTKTIPQVYKIFGPGNQYVTCAKQLIQKDGVAIDLPAGPSEVAVFADETAIPAFVAADLLSQAEHGSDSQVLLVCNNEFDVEYLMKEIGQQIAALPRKQLVIRALENSKIIVIDEQESAIKLLNEYAAEHLILSCAKPEEVAEKIINAGSIFLGNYSPESAGDYASGTNHTLPTNGYAKAYSGVSVDSFVKKITYQRLTEQGLKNIGRSVELMAEAEGLEAHRNAVTIRLNN